MTHENGVLGDIFTLANERKLSFDIAEAELVLILPDIQRRGMETLIVDPFIQDILFIEYLSDSDIKLTHQLLDNNYNRDKAERMALELFWNARKHQDFISRGNGLQLVFAKN